MLDINKIKKENLINTSKTTNELLEYLKKNYPQTISDNTPNLNAIADILGLNTKTQGYELTFTGKSFANALYNTPNTKELKFEKEQSKDEKSTKNIIIKGDNLDALKLLKQSYYEKIKMIYIDPPYNTKNDEFIYNDDFRKDYKKLLLQTGLLEIDEDGNEIESETLKFFRNIKSSKTHSAWLAFMLPRLKLARDLLREDGVIFISIDDNEQANLKILCDEIFGEENFLYCLSVVDKLNGNDNSSGMIETNEYCLLYAKNIDYFDIGVLPIDDENNEWKIDEKGWWKEGGGLKATGEESNRENRPNLFFPIYINEKNLTFSLVKSEEFSYKLLPITNKEEKRWYWNKEKFIIEKDDVIIKKTKDGYSLYKKQRPSLGDLPSKRGKTTFYHPSYSTANSDKEIKKLFYGLKVFTYSKSKNLIKDFIYLANTNQNDIILDFFAGSGTTAQAVMELNAEDNGNRKFILVQLDEKIDEKKSKVAYDFCKNELNSQNPVISDITIERVKRASEKISNENKNLDLGFKVFSMVEKPELISNDIGTLSLENHANLSPYEKALNLALQDCKILDSDIKIILKDKIYQCEQSFYVVKFDDEVLNFLKNTQNENVYINGFDDINLEIYLNLESSLKERLKVVY
ncbi:site-specific DNA-methyltransferase [Campylobacter jejuni]|nr:site-specific DNA-methyltransferase [Campylobacter jejuni]ECL2361028.1 site-specific DNA-methyltransferase [Campylobacter jejuni]HED7247193.1 site-specific DNA-methyltransferase [Campylobacter jejuni]HEG6280335.1 site-specific DNA-methyltransferase [Campylobacter jejuni]